MLCISSFEYLIEYLDNVFYDDMMKSYLGNQN